MDTTRRNILRGMAAAPLMATAGGLLVPSTAQAAAPGFTLTMRRGRYAGYLTWAAACDGLQGRLSPANVATVLATATRRGIDPGDWHDGEKEKGRKPDGFAYGFAWDDKTKDPHGKLDGRTRQWYPQGVTTSYDGYGGVEPSSGKKVMAVTWYGKGDYEPRGARVTFADVTGDPENPKYQHVLLVEPVQRPKRRATFEPVRIHAGGIAWVGNFLYVANRPGDDKDFRLGGLSVFDISKMAKVTGADKAKAYGYDYILPLHHLYENTSGRPWHSQASLDRTQGSVHSLVVSEFWDKRRGRAVRWELDTNGYIADDGQSDGDWPLNTARVQGAVSVGRDAYYAANVDTPAGKPAEPGRLWRHAGRDGTPVVYGVLAIGPEDLSYDESPRPSLWCLGEHPSRRRVYRIRLGV
ncbi:hypothetical protein OG883_33460 [Streptomyces sp. NBC_01142]|uniref:hypothetical protein n=1 Tax=Streptomyces sp. NBC_01142 TaxID=2975865 RepID=UPI00225612EF|nr:hypothetical protein [Streptomyces sp. NBC_01142]MCX4824679.1 hypothetical protein [Streptomyces sp. NBC_01142]